MKAGELELEVKSIDRDSMVVLDKMVDSVLVIATLTNAQGKVQKTFAAKLASGDGINLLVNIKLKLTSVDLR